MISKKWGRIIGIGSTAIQNPNPDLSLSSIARSSLAAYLKTLSKEVAAEGVTVNMVHPGRVDTERVRQLDRFKAEKENRPVAEIERDSIGTIPANRYGHPEEFGSTVAFLASKQASYITGVQIRVDGGRVEGY
jgi:3-oxoacyl-[acyl-carrier protein] reductase